MKINKKALALKSTNITPTLEKELVKLLQAQQSIEEAIEYVKEQLGKVMTDANTDSIELNSLKITKTNTGRRFAFDPSKPVDAQFTQTVSYPQVNSNAVDAFLTLNDELPEGILENARKVKVDIKLVE